MKQELKAAILPAFAVSSLALISCGDDDEVDAGGNRDLLVGEWEVTNIDGESLGQGQYDEFGYAYRVTLEFQADGDWIFCGEDFYEGQGSQGEFCYDGEWEFTSANVVESFYLDGGDRYEFELIITSITADRIVGDILQRSCDAPGPCTSSDDQDGPYDIIMEKVN